MGYKVINRLTVLASETFEDFAKELQKEIEQDTGEKFEGRIKKKEDKVQVSLKKGYETDRPTIAPRITTQRTQLVMENSGISGDTPSTRVHVIETMRVEVPDLLGYVQSKTELTRSTIVRILEESGRLSDCLKKPQMFLDNVIREIKAVLTAMMVQGVKYIKVAGEMYEMRLFEDGEIEAYIDNLYTVRKQEKTLYNYIESDSLSGPEKKFAKDCEDNEDVEFIIKLPRKFVIKTPIGEYRPDWALVFKGQKKLYFVAETKSGTLEADMRSKEWQKIHCGYRHFAEFPEVEFKHVKELRDLY